MKQAATEMNQATPRPLRNIRPQPGRWVPSLTMRLSLWLHIAAALCAAGVAAHAIATGALNPTASAILALAFAALVINHIALTAAGLFPRCRLLGPNLTRLPEAASRQRMVAITIDDGPDPLVTPLVLDALRDAGARASFFLIAGKAEQHPALVSRMIREGHSVENHSFAHSHSFSFSGLRRFRSEISRAQQSLARLAGQEPLFFRAPAGMRNPLLEPVLSSLGLPLTSWTRRGFDTVNRDPDRILGRLIGRQGELLAAGDILLLHDGNAARAADGQAVILCVLPRLLAACERLRLRPVSLRQALLHPNP